jgi:hypothetical protein
MFAKQKRGLRLSVQPHGRGKLLFLDLPHLIRPENKKGAVRPSIDIEKQRNSDSQRRSVCSP